WSGVDQADAEAAITIAGELELLRDEAVARLAVGDTLPGWSWQLVLGAPPPESASTAVVRETAVSSPDGSFSLSAERVDLTSGPPAASRLVGVEPGERDRWLFDVVGQMSIEGEDAESVVG